MGFASVIAASGALLGALITCALLLPVNRANTANRQLALVMGLATLYQLSTMARHSPGLQALIPIEGLGASIFLLGPGLYLYTRSRVTGNHGWRPAQLWHALPFALVILDYLLSLKGAHHHGLDSRFSHIVGVICYLQLVSYLGASLYLLRRGSRNPGLEDATLRWLATLLGTCLALCLPGLVFALARWLFNAVSWPQQLWSVTIVMAMNYLIAFFALLDPSVFHGQRAARRNREEPARYETSSLTDDQARELWQRLEDHMRSERPYLQAQLKVGQLAEALDVPPNHLSQTVNKLGGCGFASYLNGYRVAAARAILTESKPGERTMLDVALSSGFNSESAFYRHFRSLVGVTPRQFQQQRA